MTGVVAWNAQEGGQECDHSHSAGRVHRLEAYSWTLAIVALTWLLRLV
jgi:hypothetical protein